MDLMMILDELLMGNGLFIALACFLLGEFIKMFPRFNRKYIPLCAAVFGCLLACFIPNLLPDRILFVKAVTGLMLGWAATGLFETGKIFRSK